MINVVSVALLPWVVELPLATLRPVLVLQVSFSISSGFSPRKTAFCLPS
jgi:hypothetical protein